MQVGFLVDTIELSAFLEPVELPVVLHCSFLGLNCFHIFMRAPYAQMPDHRSKPPE